MLAAIVEAELGDDWLDGDPTTRRLEERVAELLGKEDALFFPSGTMANQTAIWVLAERGTEIYADITSHIVDRESVGAAGVGGVQIRTVTGEGPMMDAPALEAAIRPKSPFRPRPSLVCIENTHNTAGGLVTPEAGVRAISDVARRHGCNVFLDGARLWNAAVASNTAPRDFAVHADLVMVSFSKGLGAPAGAVLAGTDDLIMQADEHRHRLGGVMRQSGILTAGALYGLEHNMSRLGEDHAKAASFAAIVDRAIAAAVIPPETNIVMVDLAPGLNAHDVVRRAAEEGVKLQPWTRTRVRAVMHLDVSVDDAERAAQVVLHALDEAWRALGDTSEWSVAGV